ncbi:hypothetical protein [Nocardia xishanensis]|uniref:hypothetical protein n=1 Tax=Nocardia xishanensis TaxID=238964 RepID=UPI00082B25ED|nr:hypothetical protein [Nocardia xishanensis]
MLDHKLDPAKIIENLTTLGILTMRAAAGMINIRPDDCGGLWKLIGRVTVTQRTAQIDMWPCSGPLIDDADTAVLYSRGLDAWLNPPSVRPTGWTQRHDRELGPCWETEVTVPVTYEIRPHATGFGSAA